MQELFKLKRLKRREGVAVVMLCWLISISYVAGAYAKLTHQDQSELFYQFKPVLDGKSRQLKVDLWFRGNASGKTELRLPSEWGGEKELYKCIKSVEVLTPGARLSNSTSPKMKILTHKPSEVLHIRYAVIQDLDHPFDNDQYYRPLLTTTYFHLIGEAFLIIPEGDDGRTVDVTLDWVSVPKGWRLANSFGAEERHQSFRRRIREFRHAIYIMGDFRLKRIDIHEKPVWVAIRGSWKFSDEEFFDLVRKIILAERDFWNDHDFPYFLITLIATRTECCSYGGTGLTDSFATFIATDSGVDKRLKYLLAHELFHTWNGRRIDRKQPEELVYWFSEGFTDYYTHLLNLRTGLITLAEYVDEFNHTLKLYFTSPIKDVPNSRIMEDFWNDTWVQKLPYFRGAIIAHNWNTKIKLESNGRYSLDSPMRDLLKAAMTSGAVVSPETVDSVIRPYLIGGVSKDIEKFIEKGMPITPERQALGPCVKLETRDIPTFDPGFDVKTSKKVRVVQGVIQGGSAFKAGLRNGQKLLGWSVHGSNPELEAEFRVKDGDDIRKIHYLPQGVPVKTPQFHLLEEEYKKDHDRCLSWFGSKVLSAADEKGLQNFIVTQLGVEQDGTPSKAWFSVIKDRLKSAEFQQIQRTKKSLSDEERKWMEFIITLSEEWAKKIGELAKPFPTVKPPAQITILFGNQGGDDGFTPLENTIAMDLSSWYRAYGKSGGKENEERVQRILSHEYTHLLHDAWQKNNRVQLTTPLERTLWECAREGIGNFRSLSTKWLPKDGRLPQASQDVLNRLSPIFVDRLLSLNRVMTQDEEKHLLEGISSGAFKDKWGALPVALWLALEANGDDSKLAVWVQAGPEGVFTLAKKYLSRDLWEKLEPLTVRLSSPAKGMGS